MKIFTSKLLKRLLFIVLPILFVELILRVFFGFCDTVLFRESNKFEYIQIPQKRKRFGNLSFYNSFSQRNEEISAGDSVLSFFGDSVINGGVLTDQDSLATTKLSNFLTRHYERPIKVLNVAAGSWGPDNCFGYLEEYGDFKTNRIVLIVSSHDAYDNMDFKPVVGVNASYPTKQYSSAIFELFERYLLPRVLKSTSTKEFLAINKKTRNSSFNSGFIKFYHYARNHRIPLTIYLHADRLEREIGEYNSQGREIVDFCMKRNISVIKELDYNLPSSIYLDEIHLNDLGQQKIFEIMKDILLKSNSF